MNAPVVVTNSLAEHAAVIRTLGRRMFGDVIEIGRRLTECKAIAGHGNWLTWLKSEFGWKERTAQSFMRIYEMSKSANFADLSIPISGLHLLAAPSTPEEARAEVMERAEAGEQLRHAEIKEIVTAHKSYEEAVIAPALRSAAREAARKNILQSAGRSFANTPTSLLRWLSRGATHSAPTAPKRLRKWSHR